MRIDYAKQFIRQLKKAPRKIQTAFRKRAGIFIQNRYSPILNNHQLSGKYQGMRSINITGDWRAVYEEIGKDTVYFMGLGTHSQLYK